MSNCPFCCLLWWCQIVRCVKLSAVSNCPRCKIVLLALVVSNCPRCQIILSLSGTILMLDLFERRRRKKAYVPDFIRGIKERAICLREPSFLPSSLNCIFFFLHVQGAFFNCSAQISVLKRKTMFNQQGSFVHREFHGTESLLGRPLFFIWVLKIGRNS